MEQPLEAIVEAITAELQAHPDRLYDYIWACEWFNRDYRRTMDLIPPCPEHGPHCSPHVREWIRAQRARECGLVDSPPVS